jgi:hypothetical protein
MPFCGISAFIIISVLLTAGAVVGTSVGTSDPSLVIELFTRMPDPPKPGVFTHIVERRPVRWTRAG